jgi:isopenicillin-N N-acyltransferase-like protein
MPTNNPMLSGSRFPELTVHGDPAEIGRKIGEHFRATISELSNLVLERINKSSAKHISWGQAENTAKKTFAEVGKYFPDLLEELEGTAQGADVPLERLMVLNARNMLSEQAEGCTSIMVSANSSGSRSGFVGQNWDNDPAMRPLSVVITRKSPKTAIFTTWTQPGLIAYMGFNSAGTGVCMNALNGPSVTSGIPWYFFVRAILESKSFDTARERIDSAPRSITANAAMVTNHGPLDLEFTPGSIKEIESGRSGMLVHTNHCVHPDLAANNDRYAGRIYGQSFDRIDRGRALLDQRAGNRGVTVDDLKTILSDHDGYPTSICRHPNDHPVSGWQRSVVSIILEPGERRMQVSNGNPCENPYETYLMG